MDGITVPVVKRHIIGNHKHNRIKLNDKYLLYNWFDYKLYAAVMRTSSLIFII